jgi:hypothetical protein
MRPFRLTAFATAGLLALSIRVASADTALPAPVPAGDVSALPGPKIAAFHLPDSVFSDLGVTLADASASLPTGDFGFTLRDFDSEERQLPADWTGVIAVQQPRRPQPPPPDVLRGVRNWDSPYAKKFLRGTLIITGTEIASGVVLALLPSQFTKWDDTALQRGSANYKRAWTEPPTWDKDSFFNDYMGHPYAGALYYNMMRSQGGTPLQSFGFTVFQSTLWEYAIESVAEQPSIQDLVITPIAGSLVGEVFHQLSLEILKKGNLNFGQKVLVFFLNPSWVINNGFRAPE